MKKALLFAAVAAVIAGTAQAQRIEYDDLPIPAAQLPTGVTDYGFTAHWTPVEESEAGAALGYYVRTYVTKAAKQDGDKFYYLNTDFSFLKSDGTEEAPLTNVNSGNMFLIEDLNAPGRGGWKVINPGYVNGMVCLNGYWNYLAANGQMATPITDFSNGGGVVHVKFRIKSDGTGSKFTVNLRDCGTGTTNSIIQKETINATTEWQDVNLTFNGGLQQSDILFMIDEMGNQTNMYFFIDDLQVWQELKKGERARAFYKEQFVLNDINASEAYVETPDTLAEGEDYMYAVATYDTRGISHESSWATAGRDGSTPQIIENTANGISTIAATTGNDATAIYTVNGTRVSSKSASLPRGLYIVKQGGKTVKILKK